MKQTIIAIICFLWLSSSYIQAQKINHPSLLYTPQRIQQVKQRMQNEPKLQEAWESIKQTADAALQKNDFNKLDYLALAYLMTKDKSYVNSIKEILLKAVKAETWGDKEMLARIPVWRSHLGLAHKSFLCAMGYDAAYDNSSYVGYTSPNTEVMNDLKNNDFKGINAYDPIRKNNKDEVFNYNSETRKIMANYWAKVKIAASNANRN